jgi:plastocyanin
MRFVRLTVACALAGCGGGGTGPDDGVPATPPPLSVTVRATDAISFNPTPVDVRTGGTVTFQFEGTAHSVFFRPASGAPADIPGNNANVSIQRSFAEEGTFDYDCQIHPGRSGRIVVRQTGSSGGGGPGPGYP